MQCTVRSGYNVATLHSVLYKRRHTLMLTTGASVLQGLLQAAEVAALEKFVLQRFWRSIRSNQNQVVHLSQGRCHTSAS